MARRRFENLLLVMDGEHETAHNARRSVHQAYAEGGDERHSMLCADVHFSSVAKGIIDSRDILYFVSLTALFFTLTVKVEQGAKK